MLLSTLLYDYFGVGHICDAIHSPSSVIFALINDYIANDTHILGSRSASGLHFV